MFLVAFVTEEAPPVALHSDYGNFDANCGVNRPPGTKTIAYAFPTVEVETWPDLKTTTSPGDSLTYDGDIAMVTVGTGLGYMRKINIVSDTGKISAAWVGERGGKAWQNSFGFFLAGTATETIEWINCFINTCSVVMIPTREKPLEYKVFGSPTDPAVIESVELDSGEAVGDRSGTAIVVQDVSGNPIYTYAGVIDVTPVV